MTRLLLVALAAMIDVAPVQAQQPQCAPHDEVLKVLHEKYQEKKQAIGLIGDRAMMEVFVSDKGTWTFLVTGPDGVSCLLGAGNNWEWSTDAFKPGKGA